MTTERHKAIIQSDTFELPDMSECPDGSKAIRGALDEFEANPIHYKNGTRVKCIECAKPAIVFNGEADPQYCNRTNQPQRE